MKALVKTALGQDTLKLMDVPKPACGPDDIVVKIYACGICASDLHIENFLIHPPFVLGHEFSGTVCEIGANVADFKCGDPVVSITAVQTCEECEYCRQGLRMHCCGDRKNIGTGRDGGFAEYMVIPAKQAFHIPDGVFLDAAALCEPLACVVRGVIERTTVRAGDYVLVAGAGIIGQLTALVARMSGGIVFMTGMKSDVKRLAKALELGCTAVFAVDEMDAVAEIMRLTGGMGVDCAFECAGAAPSADLCLHALKKMGSFTQIGLYTKPILFDMDLAVKKEISISNSIASERSSWLTALRLLQHHMIDTAPLVGEPLPLTEWEEAWRRMIAHEDFKILLRP
ncbi:MAG: zinc-binding dehydrogenase [Intestinibacillus sp.]